MLYYRAVCTMTGYSLQPSKLKSISFTLSQLFLIFWKICLWFLPAKGFQKAKFPLENKGVEFAFNIPDEDMQLPWNIWKTELTRSLCNLSVWALDLLFIFHQDIIRKYARFQTQVKEMQKAKSSTFKLRTKICIMPVIVRYSMWLCDLPKREVINLIIGKRERKNKCIFCTLKL